MTHTEEANRKWLRWNPGDADMRSGKNLFFVTGRSKSGTTWMALLLNSHPGIFCDRTENNAFHQDMELRFFGKRTTDLHAAVGTFYENRHLSLVKSGLIANLITRCRKDTAVRLGDKTPRQSIKKIFEAFDRTRVIVMLRDFRDALVSLAYHRKRYTGTWEGIFAANDEAELDENFIKDALSGFEKCDDIRTYFEYAGLYPGQVTIVRYEDLKIDTGRVLKKVCSFLEVDTDEASIKECVEKNTFERHSGGRKAGVENRGTFFRKGIVGDWKNHFSPANVEVFKTYGGESLILAGYEKNNNWSL